LDTWKLVVELAGRPCTATKYQYEFATSVVSAGRSLPSAPTKAMVGLISTAGGTGSGAGGLTTCEPAARPPLLTAAATSFTLVPAGREFSRPAMPPPCSRALRPALSVRAA